ncbi:MAG: hypothetical protein E7411_08780 [Ruminococcaceae bacterium]|nr:hypothetical protein [Oscillospiraceae bacterium]
MKRFLSLIISLSLILSLCPGIFAWGAENVLFDSFESEDGPWKHWSNAGKALNSISSDCATEGEKAFLLNDNSAGLAGGFSSERVSITEGATYTALIDVYMIYGTVAVNLRFYDESGTRLSSPSKKPPVSDKWQTVAITDVAPKGAALCDVVVATNAATMGICYLDNLRVTEGKADAGTPNGSIPKNPPKYVAEDTKVEAKDDGVKDGELIYSYDFENGLNDWGYANNASETYVEEISSYGTNNTVSIHINDIGDGVGPGIKSPDIPVSEGNVYTVLFDSYGVSGTMKVYVKFFDNQGATLSQVSFDIASGGWGVSMGNVTAPKGCTKLTVTCCGILATQGEAYIDNCKVYKGKVKISEPDKSFIPPKQVKPVNSELVAPVNNKLVYNTYTDKGDKLSDFSYGGYYKGEYELPDTAGIPVAMEISPTGTDDDTAHIQAAIDKVYSESQDNTLKLLKLKAGTYNINSTGIKLKSGIVLSGEGQGPTGTILYAKDPVAHTPVHIAGKPPVITSGNAFITDDYLPAGSKVIHVSESDAAQFKAGDTIVIYHPSTKKWGEAIYMNPITNNSNAVTSWGDKNVDMMTERTITAVNGGEITLDFGLFVPYMKELTASYIYRIDETNKIVNAGIQNLRVTSYYNGDPTDEKHATILINISYARDIFVRDVTGMHFVNSFVCADKRAKQVTVMNCSAIEPVSKVAGSRRYNYACKTSAQQLLYISNYSKDGRHDLETSAPVTGPISYVDNVVDESTAGTETHGTWSTGVLFDNVYNISNDTKGTIGFKNHGVYGSVASQGWTAATAVAWNCLSPTIIGHKPPLTYQNFMIGTWGIYTDSAAENMKKTNIERYTPIYKTSIQEKYAEENFATKEGTPFVGDCYKEAEFTPVEPRSLFKAQLSERFTGTIQNARANAPIIVNPKCDKEFTDGNVTVSGISQLGATEVFVYIDDVKYTATVASDNSFAVSAELKDGVHKIYATQVIGGFEGVKTSDRFIIVGKADGNPSYLQSIYPPEKTRLLINDKRPTIDEVEKKLREENAGKINVIVNSVQLESDVAPFIENGRTLVPMRAIFEALKADVLWDGATETATATKEGIQVKITKNQTVAYLNDNPITLDVPASIYSGRFMVPVRFISESFGEEVVWDGVKRTVIIGNIAFPASHGLMNELDVSKAIQSGDDGAGAVIDNVFDNDYTTKWGVAYDESNPEGAFGIFDLGSSKNIKSIQIAFSAGNARVYNVDFYVSDDGVNFTPALMGHKSSGTTTEFEEISINKKARYLKIVGKGNSVNKWMNIQEVAIISE